MLQSTLGNLPELFVVIFALRAGEAVVAQTSIIGSLFANALLVLGAGDRRRRARAPTDGVMRFRPRLPNDTATLLLRHVFIIVIVGDLAGSHDPASQHVTAISTVAAVCLLGGVPRVGGAVRARRRSRRGRATAGTSPRVPLAVVARRCWRRRRRRARSSRDWFIHALEPTIEQLGVSEAFAGLVIVAIAGNAVENATGLVLAGKGQTDLAISVVKNSVAQIAAFLFPVLVLISLLFSHTLTFALEPGLHRRAGADRALGLADHRRRRGRRVRGLGAGRASTSILAALTLYE